MGQIVPPAPAHRADRFGVYFWDPDYQGWPGTTDKLTWGSKLVAETGTRTIRLFLGYSAYGCNDKETGPYGVFPTPNPDDQDYLVRIAQVPSYKDVFNDPRYSTYLLTVYTVGAELLQWNDGFDEQEYEYEKTRIFRLASELINNYKKTFIIFNWEGDHHFSKYPGARDGYVRWIESMAEGVAAARNSNRGAPGRIFSGLEFNCVANIGSSCGVPGTPIVLDYVAPRLRVDYLSYSSWATLAVNKKVLHSAILGAVKTILSKANSRHLVDNIYYKNANVIIGEYGFDQTQMTGLEAAERVKIMFRAAEAAGVSYAIYWQILNNRETGNPSCLPARKTNFGLLSVRDGNRISWNSSGVAFIDAIAGR